MKRIVFFSVTFIILFLPVLGQKTLKVTPKDMTGVIFREAGNNETVVEVQSELPLNFESTMDKEVNVYNFKEENGFFFYYLKFPVGNIYNGRKLIIMSHGYLYHYEPLNLRAKIPVGLYVGGEPNSQVNKTAYPKKTFFEGNFSWSPQPQMAYGFTVGQFKRVG